MIRVFVSIYPSSTTWYFSGLETLVIGVVCGGVAYGMGSQISGLLGK